MSWQHWVIAAFFLLNVVIAPVGIGKPRGDRTPGIAVFAVLLSFFFLMLLVWGQR